MIGGSREDFVVVQGLRDTRATFAMWHRDHWRVLGPWFAGALGIALLLLFSVWTIARIATPDPSPVALAGVTHPASLHDAWPILYRNSLVLALHAMACVAGFIAGSSMPIAAEAKTGIWRKVHNLAGPAAIAFVAAATTFSLSTQAYALGARTSDLSYQFGLSPLQLLLTLTPHAIPELVALFLPLSAWLIASRRDNWHHLMAATFVTTAIAVPMLLASCAIELWVSPKLLLAILWLDHVRLPADNEAFAPEFPQGLQWVNVAFLRMAQQIGRPILVEFFDSARINSHRTLPYMRAWQERYGDTGLLRIIGVHSPGYSFGRDPATAAAAVERMEIPYAVVLDPDFAVWREYGNRGWPARFVFDRRGVLRFVHWGEGEYEETERVIQELIRETDPEGDLELPDLLEPLRPEDAADAQMDPQTADVTLPAEVERVELSGAWLQGADYVEAQEAGATAHVQFRAGEAYAVLSGSIEAGLYPTDGTVVAEAAGLRLHGFQFTPLPPSH